MNDLLPRYSGPKVALPVTSPEKVESTILPPDEAAIRRHRILLKLGTPWGAKPNDSLSTVLAEICPWIGREEVLDDEVERLMNDELRAAGLSVSGGWRS